jgi:hypothetical protein
MAVSQNGPGLRNKIHENPLHLRESGLVSDYVVANSIVRVRKLSTRPTLAATRRVGTARHDFLGPHHIVSLVFHNVVMPNIAACVALKWHNNPCDCFGGHWITPSNQAHVDAEKKRPKKGFW